MSTSQELTKNNLVILRSRALQKARAFFYDHGYYEVDCPILSPFAALDNHIDLFTTNTSPPYFLHSSPEYGMKKLLCQNAPSIFQISHVFRQNESSMKHAQEFTMAEFYKLGILYEDFIEHTCLFLELFTGKKTRVYLSYQEVFLKYLALDPYSDLDAIKDLVISKLGFESLGSDPDDILTTAMGALIEPLFDPAVFTIIKNFPASQAALAEVSHQDNKSSLRFEIYYQGYELCNGYKEEKDPSILKERFERLNMLRTHQHKQKYPIDQELLEKMEKNFPDCCGVACGFDRLFMLECGLLNIQEVLSCPSV